MRSRVPQKLSHSAKQSLRNEARQIFYKANPKLAGKGLEIHHRNPLEWAHLFPEADPNRLANLVGLDDTIHNMISDKWTGFRIYYQHLGRSPSAQEVLDFVASIDKVFSQFYNKPLK